MGLCGLDSVAVQNNRHYEGQSSHVEDFLNFFKPIFGLPTFPCERIRRWTIEEWHRVIKDCRRVEDLALRDLDHMKRAMTLKVLVAWFIMYRLKLGLKVDSLPVEDVFDDLEAAVLRIVVMDMNLDVEDAETAEPGTLKTAGGAVKAVAMLGGHLGRKGDGDPGLETFGSGTAALAVMRKFSLALRRNLKQAIIMLVGEMSLSMILETVWQAFVWDGL